MPQRKRNCAECEAEYTLMPGKPGLATHCPECSEGDEEVPMVMAKVAWSGKHTMELEITANREEAAAFNKAQARGSCGPLSSMCAPKEGAEGRESGKRDTGSELGALYHSGLGEKRSVKGGAQQ